MSVRATAKALQGRVHCQGKVSDGDKMAVERQELPHEGFTIVLEEGEETSITSKSKNPHNTRYTAVSPIVYQFQFQLHNIPCLKYGNAITPQVFGSGKGILFAVEHPSALSCYPFYSGMMQRHYYSHGHCYGPSQCHYIYRNCT